MCLSHCPLSPPHAKFNFNVILSCIGNNCCCCCVLQDLQAEIEAHQHVFESLNNTGRSLVRVEAASDDPKDGKVLAKRLDDMNTRWMQLKTKSVEIRSVNPP